MANNIVKNANDGTLKIIDGAGSPASVTVSFINGDLSITEPGYEGKEPIMVYDRGAITQVIDGNDVPIDWSFSAKLVTITDSSTPTIRDAFKKAGGAAAWTSTSAKGKHTLDLEWTLTAKSDGSDEVITINDCFAESIEVAEGDEFDTVSVSGKSISTAVVIT